MYVCMYEGYTTNIQLILIPQNLIINGKYPFAEWSWINFYA